MLQRLALTWGGKNVVGRHSRFLRCINQLRASGRIIQLSKLSRRRGVVRPPNRARNFLNVDGCNDATGWSRLYFKRSVSSLSAEGYRLDGSGEMQFSTMVSSPRGIAGSSFRGATGGVSMIRSTISSSFFAVYAGSNVKSSYNVMPSE